VEDQALAGAQKKCAKESRVIVFIDESGISERPHRVRTWAPKGQTPILQYSFTWKQLSAIAGVSFWNIYFKLVQGAFRAPEIVAFLKALRRHLKDRKLLIVWDRLQAHRSRLVRDFVDSQAGAVQLEFCRPTRRSLTRSNISGLTGSTTSLPTSVRRTLPNSALMPEPNFDAHSVARRSSPPSGGKLNCPSDVTLFVTDQ
jgi:DDE superfamily endonuclease